jgi:hypothetical protein
MPFFAAHVAIGADTCGSDIEKRAMYGRARRHHRRGRVHHHHRHLRLGRTGAAAIASGVKPKPARNSTVVARHQLLCEALGDLGVGPAGVAHE